MATRDFVALGGVWLDEIRKDGELVHSDVLGGSVTYATIGARLFQATPRAIRLVVLAGNDFPDSVVRDLRGWNLDLSIHWNEALPHARGIVNYGQDESDRYYQRLTSPLNSDWSQLSLSELLTIRCFHFFETPELLYHNVSSILDARSRNEASRPIVIWEPQAKTMKPHTLDEHLTAAKSVDVFSPNHAELAGLFKNSIDYSDTFDSKSVEEQAKHFVARGVRSDSEGCVVVRCAEYGCLVLSSNIEATWLPAYHTSGDKVVNTTGAGNAFLGAFGIGLMATGDYVQAAVYGQVAASFVIEQIGLPMLSGQGVNERWNGASVRDRLTEYQERLQVAKS